jgi:hypothetical protein
VAGRQPVLVTARVEAELEVDREPEPGVEPELELEVGLEPEAERLGVELVRAAALALVRAQADQGVPHEAREAARPALASGSGLVLAWALGAVPRNPAKPKSTASWAPWRASVRLAQLAVQWQPAVTV